MASFSLSNFSISSFVKSPAVIRANKSRYSFAMISLEKKLYLTGGDRSQIKPPMGFSLTGSGGLPSGFVYEKYSNKIYVYDIISNTWTIINK